MDEGELRRATESLRGKKLIFTNKSREISVSRYFQYPPKNSADKKLQVEKGTCNGTQWHAMAWDAMGYWPSPQQK